MNLSGLPKITTTAHKRLGLGHGSGHGKTSGRGTKGQKARRNIPLRFEGGALPLTKRLPFLRGKGRLQGYGYKPVIITLSMLATLPKGAVVDVEKLVERKLVEKKVAKRDGVKVLANGELTVALTVKLPVSKEAQKKIEKAGGQVVA